MSADCSVVGHVVTPMRCLEKVLKMCFYFDTIVFFLTSSGIYAVVILKDGESDSGEETAQSLKQLVKEDWLLCCPSACYMVCYSYTTSCCGLSGIHEAVIQLEAEASN